jgi:hypothetical protein
MYTIIAWIVVVIVVVVMCIPWKWNTKDMRDTQHPAACFDCNKTDCSGCVLEDLTTEQADAIATQRTQQAIADNTIAYGKRFDKRG